MKTALPWETFFLFIFLLRAIRYLSSVQFSHDSIKKTKFWQQNYIRCIWLKLDSRNDTKQSSNISNKRNIDNYWEKRNLNPRKSYGVRFDCPHGTVRIIITTHSNNVNVERERRTSTSVQGNGQQARASVANCTLVIRIIWVLPGKSVGWDTWLRGRASIILATI